MQKIPEHPGGVPTTDIKEWLLSIDYPRFFGKSTEQVSNVLNSTLYIMKSKSGLIERKDGKWYRRLDSEAAAH